VRRELIRGSTRVEHAGGTANDELWRVRAAILERKRREYRDMVPDYYDIADRSADELGALRQVHGVRVL